MSTTVTLRGPAGRALISLPRGRRRRRHGRRGQRRCGRRCKKSSAVWSTCTVTVGVGRIGVAGADRHGVAPAGALGHGQHHLLAAGQRRRGVAGVGERVADRSGRLRRWSPRSSHRSARSLSVPPALAGAAGAGAAGFRCAAAGPASSSETARRIGRGAHDATTHTVEDRREQAARSHGSFPNAHEPPPRGMRQVGGRRWNSGSPCPGAGGSGAAGPLITGRSAKRPCCSRRS